MILAAILLRSRSFHELIYRKHLPQKIVDWQQFDGIWEGNNGTFSDLKGGGGDKALAGSEDWTDYTLDADIRFDSDRNARWGDAGVIVRASDPTIGTDAYNGYYVGLRLHDHVLVLSRSENEYLELETKQLAVPLMIGNWYHISVTIEGCAVRASVNGVGKDNLASVQYTDHGCPFRHGKVGLRTYNIQASWRNVAVTAAH